MDIGRTARRWVVLNKDKQPGGVLMKVDAGHEDLGERANVLGRGEGGVGAGGGKALRERDTDEKSMSGQSSSSIEADRNEDWGMEGMVEEVEVTEEDKVRASPGLLLGRCVSEDFPSPDEEEEGGKEEHVGGRKKQVVGQGKGARNRNMYDGCIVKYSPSSKLYTIYFVDEGCADGVDSEQYKFSIEAALKILLPRSAGQTARVKAKIDRFMKKHKPKQTVATPPGNGTTGKASSSKKGSSHDVSRSKAGWGASGGGGVPRAIQQAVHQAGMTQAELGRELGLRQAAELAGLNHWLVRR